MCERWAETDPGLDKMTPSSDAYNFEAQRLFARLIEPLLPKYERFGI
jgi:hypothetical protein